MGGRPRIQGLRVTVGTIVGLLAAGHEQDEVLAAYPPPQTWRHPRGARLRRVAQRRAGSRGRFQLTVLIDMNLSPRWVETLERAGIEARHWSAVGEGAASDRVVFDWARRHGCVV